MTVYDLGGIGTVPIGSKACAASECNVVDRMSLMQFIIRKHDTEQIQLWTCADHYDEVFAIAEGWAKEQQRRYEKKQEELRTERFIRRLLG